MYFEVYGDGQPLVLLTPFGIEDIGATHFPHFIEGGYQIIALALRGFGKTIEKDKTATLTFDLMASDLNQLLDHLELDSVYLFGEDVGANVGLRMGLDYSRKIKKMVLQTPFAQADSTAFLPILVNWLENEAPNAENEDWKRRMDLLMGNTQVPMNDLKNITTETLLLTDDRGEIKLTHSLEIFKRLPNSNLGVVPGGDGLSFIRKKEIVFSMVDHFFKHPFSKPNAADWYK